MVITVNEKTHFIFDLDDTLYAEIDFLKSAYHHIAQMLSAYINEDVYETMWQYYTEKKNVFSLLIEQYGDKVPLLTIEQLLHEYRNHEPAIKLSEETLDFINKAVSKQIPFGIITDGRSITQRNKLKALGIEDKCADIIISEEFGSEKPAPGNFLFFQEKYSDKEFYFFGDNTSKDFIVPAKLGWTTICIKNSGNNIHQQDVTRPPVPDYIISSYNEIELI